MEEESSPFLERNNSATWSLREGLLGKRDSVRFENNAWSTTEGAYESECQEEEVKKGKPFFHRGQSLGNTSRIVQVDRKTWDLFTGRSLGRRKSCQFSPIEEASMKVVGHPLFRGEYREHHEAPTDEKTAPRHLSLFGLPTVSPYNLVAKLWLAFIAVTDMTYTAFFIPYMTAFMSHRERAFILEMIDILTGIIFLLDVFVKFHIGFVIQCDYRTKVEMRGKHIAWYYFSHGGAWIDFISVVPSILGILVILLGSLTKDAPVHLIRYIRMIRIVRLIRALSSTRALTSMESRLFQLLGPTTLYLLSVVYCLVVLINFLGCLLYFVAVTEDSNLTDTWIYKYDQEASGKSDAYHYLLGVYWAITTVTTVGFGDVTPNTWIELLLMGIIMLTQIVIFGFLIGTMTEIVTNSMTQLRQAEKYKKKMKSVEAWLMHYDIPEDLVGVVKGFYSQVWMRKQDVDECQILNELPHKIGSSVIYAIVGRMLEKIPLFQFLEGAALYKIASKMRPCVKYPDEYISANGEDENMIFILDDGRASVIGSRGASYRYSAPEVFGSGSILSSLTSYKAGYIWRLRAYSCCHVWKLKMDELLDVIDSINDGHRRLKKGLQQLLLQRMATYTDDHALRNMLQLELGRALSMKETTLIKREIYKEDFCCDDIAEILQSSDRLPLTRSESIASAYNQIEERLRPAGSSRAMAVDSEDTFERLRAVLQKAGVHGAVKFVADLFILGDDSISHDIIIDLIAKAGVDVDYIDLTSLQSTRRLGTIRCRTVLDKLLANQETENTKNLKQLYFQIFGRRRDVGLDDMIAAYQAHKHPDVLSGVRSRSHVLREALSVLLADDYCAVGDFILYHQLVGLCIKDSAFEAFTQSIWKFRIDDSP